MPYFFGDGFDLYAAPSDTMLGYWDSGTAGFTLGTGRFTGSRAAVHSATGAWLVKSSGSNDATHHIVCAYQQTAAISGTTLGLYFQLTDGTTNQCCIVFRSDGAILLTSATPGGTVLATYTGAVPAAGTWYAFEFEVVINNTTGSFAVRKNGNTSNDFSATSLNTRPGANAYANKLTVGSNAGVTGASFDDVLWRSDSTAPAWVGDIRCYTRRPASDAAVQWSQGGTPTALTQTAGLNEASRNASLDYFTLFTSSYTGSVTSVGVAVVTVGTATQMKCTIYADNGAGTGPGAVLGSAAAVTPVAGTTAFTFSGVPVVAGNKYWVGSSANNTSLNYAASSGNSAVGATANNAYGSFPQASPVVTYPSNAAQRSWTIALPAGNAALVSEPQQDATATYVYSGTPGAQDRYVLSDISSTPSTIVGVTTRGLLTKSDAGTRLAAVQLRSGATTVQAAGVLSNAAWGWLWRSDATDPATGAAWTVSGVAAAQIGAQVTG